MREFDEKDRERKLKLVETLLLLVGILGTLLIIFQPSVKVIYLFSLFILGCLAYYFIVIYELERFLVALYFSAISISATFSGLLAILISKGIGDLPSPIILITSLFYYFLITIFIFLFLIKKPKKKK